LKKKILGLLLWKRRQLENPPLPFELEERWKQLLRMKRGSFLTRKMYLVWWQPFSSSNVRFGTLLVFGLMRSNIAERCSCAGFLRWCTINGCLFNVLKSIFHIQIPNYATNLIYGICEGFKKKTASHCLDQCHISGGVVRNCGSREATLP